MWLPSIFISLPDSWTCETKSEVSYKKHNEKQQLRSGQRLRTTNKI